LPLESFMSARHAILRYDDFYGMLSDSVRMQAYERALKETVRPGDVVLDLGAGTGILGFIALKMGAAKVYAIEKSDAIELAREIAAQNGFSDRMVFIRGNSKDAALPEKVDLIVSETLGSFAVDENTLDFTLDARRRFLKDGGRMIPRGLQLFVVPTESHACQEKLAFWSDICGVDFSPAHNLFMQKIMIEDIAPRDLLGEPVMCQDICLETNESAELASKVYLPFNRGGCVHGIAGWFVADLAERIAISTAPGQPKTHWKQAFLPVRETIQVTDRDVMELTIRYGPKKPTATTPALPASIAAASSQMRPRLLRVVTHAVPVEVA
jgi:type I protein arginine methyltransferase